MVKGLVSVVVLAHVCALLPAPSNESHSVLRRVPVGGGALLYVVEADFFVTADALRNITLGGGWPGFGTTRT